MLRSFAVSIIGRDSEGEYQPEFVRDTLRAMQEKPTKRFISARQFLADLKRAK